MPVVPKLPDVRPIVASPLGREALSDLFDSLDGAMYVLDGALRLIHFNDGWRRLPPEHGWLKLSGPPESGHPFLWYVRDPVRRDELAAMLRHVLTEGVPRDIQALTDCGRVWRISLLPWRREGRVRGVICRVADDPALAGAQTQLQQLQKMETLGALTAGIAHDFNNLLLAIRGNASLLLMDEKTDATKRARLGQVELAAERASDLSQRLLAIGRPTEEKPAIIDFNQAVQEAADLATRALRGRVALAVTPAPEPPRVQMDFTTAVQAVLNLCLNAGDAMQPGGGQVTIANEFVRLEAPRAARVGRDAGELFVCCIVADTGSGIPPEVLPRIFTPFFTTKPRGKGTGLGLAMVHRSVHEAGGFIEVESEPGAGTTFRIFLPLDPRPLHTGETEFRRQITPGSGRVLVVDDLDLVRDFAQSFLQRAGYNVVAANSAEAALRMLEEQAGTIDLVLSDYSMPGENGWQLVRKILDRWPRIACLLASGYLDEAELAEIEADGRVRLLNKPYSIGDATALLSEASSRARSKPTN